jgi:hypothetical protein
VGLGGRGPGRSGGLVEAVAGLGGRGAGRLVKCDNIILDLRAKREKVMSSP